MGEKEVTFHIFACAVWDRGYSGSDRIFVELSRRFSEKGFKVVIYTWERGEVICRREGLIHKNITIKVYPLARWLRFGFAFQYLIRIWKSVQVGLTILFENNDATVIYSASDFWMDSLPCILLKLRFRKVVWIGTYYLAAPNPFRGFRENGEVKLPSIKGIIYWSLQQPIFLCMRNLADYIFTTSEPDINRFPKHKTNKKYFVIKGGVNIEEIKKWKKELGIQSKKYEAVFMGRFHTQKGVLELIDIWKLVVDSLPDAKLIMIGDGPLMDEVKRKIILLKLFKNISLSGYLLDGKEKYTIFAQSKLFMHPVLYDSGGMSAAEGMIWGLPAIAFDLKALKTYYPKGMVRVGIGDIKAFAEAVIFLLTNHDAYKKLRQEAKKDIEENWDWNIKVNTILQLINI